MTPSAFRAFTFDCYGTLIDWERGILQAIRALPGIDADDEALLAAFARHEHAVQEEHPAMLYPEVLSNVCKAIAADFGRAATEEQAAAFGASIADWPPFPDTVEALAYLRRHGLLMVLSNVDRASFAQSAPAPGRSVPRRRLRRGCRELQARARALRAGPRRCLRKRESRGARCSTWRRVCSTTCSPAAPRASPPAGSTARAGRPGGATPPVDVEPDITFPDLASLAAWHRSGGA